MTEPVLTVIQVYSTSRTGYITYHLVRADYYTLVDILIRVQDREQLERL